ncbi:TLC domain-containing protein [Aspergillus coremiiformis]|uniref:TLC domain-containing protein n=1 Tax=Aspergillus coremiiformis TaxID=138285 RepID=A0A5N6Z6P4_9EURO|nr:TLC domain-containing protein [Aspergillus coremiiformis]
MSRLRPEASNAFWKQTSAVDQTRSDSSPTGMLDPFPPPPTWLRDRVEPWALYFNLPTLSDHIHEVLIALAGYQFIHSVLSPWLSAILFPRHYPHLNKRTKLNWDVHVVSLVQSTLVNTLALWIMFADKERKSMDINERIYGYTGTCGFLEALAAGYFVYDLIISTIHIKLFGVGMLFHAISALWVFSFGFRPFVNFYSPTFILYELSSPFLNIHWFLDKLNLTGSNLQWYNGMLLLSVFFSCRLVWGTWQSVLVYRDMWHALSQSWTLSSLSTAADVNVAIFGNRKLMAQNCVDEACLRANEEVFKYAGFSAGGVPTWLVGTYVAANVVLNSLNYYWFSKMVETVLKRFRGPKEGEKKIGGEKVEEVVEDIAQKVVLEAAATLEEEEGRVFLGDVPVEQGVVAGDVDVGGEVRRRRG